MSPPCVSPVAATRRSLRRSLVIAAIVLAVSSAAVPALAGTSPVPVVPDPAAVQGTGDREPIPPTQASPASVPDASDSIEVPGDPTQTRARDLGASSADSPFRLVLESNADAAAGLEVFVNSYPTFADVLADTNATGSFSDVNISPSFTTTGFTFDGEAYHLVLESNADAAAGLEVFVNSYPTFADMLADTNATGSFSDVNISPSFTTTGFTFDGEAYHLVLESNADAAAGLEVFVNSYPTFADMLADTNATGSFSDVNISPSFTTTGFTFDGEAYHLVLESECGRGGWVGGVRQQLSDLCRYVGRHQRHGFVQRREYQPQLHHDAVCWPTPPVPSCEDRAAPHATATATGSSTTPTTARTPPAPTWTTSTATVWATCATPTTTVTGCPTAPTTARLSPTAVSPMSTVTVSVTGVTPAMTATTGSSSPT